MFCLEGRDIEPSCVPMVTKDIEVICDGGNMRLFDGMDVTDVDR